MDYWKLGVIEHEERVKQNLAPRTKRDIHFGKNLRSVMAKIAHILTTIWGKFTTVNEPKPMPMTNELSCE